MSESRIIKALSIRQPWAGLIVAGDKDVENRSWYSSYRGPLLIHASKQVDREAQSNFLDSGFELPAQCAWTGGFIGMAMVKGWYMGEEFDPSRSEWHRPGSYGAYLEDRVHFDRCVAARGQLSLFNVDMDEVVAALRTDVNLFEPPRGQEAKEGMKK